MKKLISTSILLFGLTSTVWAITNPPAPDPTEEFPSVSALVAVVKVGPPAPDPTEEFPPVNENRPF
jgi:hypothetical protein